MSIAEKILRAKSDYEAVFEAGKAQGGDNYYDAFWDNYQRNGNRKNYRYAFYGQGWTLETFKPKYDLIVTDNGEFMFAYSQIKCDLVELLKDLGITLDLSKATAISQCLRNTYFTRFGELNFSNKKSLNYVLDQNPYLETIDKLIISDDGTTTFVSTFASDWELKNITFEGVIGQDIDFKNCSKLTHDSLMSIINALKPLVTYEEVETKATDYYLNGGPPIEAQVWEAGVWYKIQRTSGSYVYFDSVTYGDLEFAICDKTTRTDADASTVIGDATHIKIEEDGVAFWLKTTKGVSSGETKTLTIGDTNLAKLTDAEKKIATDKGWVLA